ncbi:hypothetical protein ABGB14_35760 [Nonomuraea sp. B10E15]|uniref:hypothetical protein n=1 Tax=Nonomuraea sp. B10E15 TaxID=3153560 RepID=UPI00325E897F
MLVELFPAHTRVSGASVGFNLAPAAIGGPGPLVAAALVTATGIAVGPAYYMVAITLIGSVALLHWLAETVGVDLTEAMTR